HELLLYKGEGELIDDIPSNVTTTILTEKNRVRDAFETISKADAIHLYTINRASFFRDLAYLAGVPIIDNPRNMIDVQDPHRVEYIGCASWAIGQMQSVPSKIRIIPNGLSFDKQSSPDYQKFSEDAPPNLIEIGRPDKERVIKAEDFMPRINQFHPDVTCHVVGRNGEDQNGIVYHGEVENPEPIYEHSHFLVHHPDLEPFGMTVLESYLHGVIPIVSGEGGIKQLVSNEETGYYVEEVNETSQVNQLNRVIQQYKSDPEFWIPMARNGFEYLKENYHIDHFIERYEQLYKELPEPEISTPVQNWSNSFQALYENQTTEQDHDTIHRKDPEEFPNVHERNWQRLNKAERLAETGPDTAEEFLDNLEDGGWNDPFKECYLRSEIHYHREEWPESIKWASKAIEKEPTVAEPYFTLTECQVKLNQYDKALESLESFEPYVKEEFDPTKELRNSIQELTD
ncbi:MAG: glycosyltransferase, partial [bacterium]